MAAQAVNLNLVPLMRALLKHRSVTLAAHSLGISQSAASQALARLRIQFDDPLLMRVGGRMQLTPLASTLALRVETVGAQLDNLFLRSTFDPRSAERIFVIAAGDYMVYLVARTMLDLQRAEAPRIRMHFIDISSNLAEQLTAQEVDFALIPRFAMRDLTNPPLRYQTLGADEPGVLMDRAHPLAAQSVISEADLARYECVMFQGEHPGHSPSKHWEPPPEVAPLSKAMQNVAVRINSFTLVPHLLRGTDLVAILPFGIGLELSSFWPTEVRRLSFGPAKVEHGLVWSPVFDADPAHVWFRTQVAMRIPKKVAYGTMLPTPGPARVALQP